MVIRRLSRTCLASGNPFTEELLCMPVVGLGVLELKDPIMMLSSVKGSSLSRRSLSTCHLSPHGVHRYGYCGLQRVTRAYPIYTRGCGATDHLMSRSMYYLRIPRVLRQGVLRVLQSSSQDSQLCCTRVLEGGSA